LVRTFHVVGLDDRGAIALRHKWSRLANMPPRLIGMEACVGAHHLSRKLKGLGHDARLMPAKYVRPYSKGQKSDFRDAEAIAEAVRRPTMKFVAIKTADQLDLQALHRVRERLAMCPRIVRSPVDICFGTTLGPVCQLFDLLGNALDALIEPPIAAEVLDDRDRTR
jgi:hypothetical protein